MRQIAVSAESEQKHRNYYRKYILPELINSIGDSYVKMSVMEFIRLGNKYINITRFVNQHSYFIRFVQKRYKIFATGRISELKELHLTIQRLFPLVTRMLESKLKGRKYHYGEYLYRLFGYEFFKVEELFEYLNKQAQRRVKQKKYTPKVQEEIVQILVDLFPRHRSEIHAKMLPGGQTLTVDQCRQAFRKLPEINITLDNFSAADVFGNEWNDYALVLNSGIRVCPYCNRQYITPIYSDRGMMRADIDHFLSKKRYPYFSMSLYNLVPVCKSCNQSLKRDKEFGFDHIHPYEDNIGDYFKFKAKIVTNDIEIQIKDKQHEINYHLDTFKIGPLYNYHRNQVNELVRKRITYPDSYIRQLYEENKNFYNSEDELKQLIVGFIEDPSKMNDEVFLKLKRDIAEQLGFLTSRNEVRIRLLKQILKSNS